MTIENAIEQAESEANEMRIVVLEAADMWADYCDMDDIDDVMEAREYQRELDMIAWETETYYTELGRAYEAEILGRLS